MSTTLILTHSIQMCRVYNFIYIFIVEIDGSLITHLIKRNSSDYLNERVCFS